MEIVTVCLDIDGAEGARPAIERAQPTHWSLIDERHVVDELFGIVNIPNSVWIDERGSIVRPAEPAWPTPDTGDRPARDLPAELPERVAAMMDEASRITADRTAYVDALRDWADKGSESRFALSPTEVIERSGTRGGAEARAAAEFELGHHLHTAGRVDEARPHFAEAHRGHPDNWTYKRQAWELASRVVGGDLARFWQGPVPGNEASWPYDGDWVSDIKQVGAENYYPSFQP